MTSRTERIKLAKEGITAEISEPHTDIEHPYPHAQVITWDETGKKKVVHGYKVE